jgi:hypothetical protein
MPDPLSAHAAARGTHSLLHSYVGICQELIHVDVESNDCDRGPLVRRASNRMAVLYSCVCDSRASMYAREGRFAN